MSSKTREERVVSIQFDNKSFEKNISATLSSLDRLKEKLSFKGVKDGFASITKAASNVNLDSVEKSVEVLQAKFSALDVMAVTALANITTAAMNSGAKIVKALTIDPVMTGFSEYETKINAVQTILANTASKGTDIADVTRVLDELNTYADKTIYNFAEMTRNIGKFTAAGVGLEESASAIKGISNLAASSGSNAQQTATAMYQLSQALAAGTVKLMDWNSVVNAGMGGEKFQEALKQTAREHGIAVDAMIKKNGSFRESLQEGWISADILNETLKKFTVEGATEYANAMMTSGKWTQAQADALIKEAQMMEDAATKVKTVTQLWDTLKESVQSGWAQTWELIIGDFEDSKYLLSSIGDFLTNLIGKASDARNALLQNGMGSRWRPFVAEIEQAGISADVFSEKLKEIARVNGVAIDEMIAEYGSLEKAINKGKISTNLLRTALRAFTDTADGSNAKLIEIRDSLNSSSGYMYQLTAEMEHMTGRELFFDSLKNALQPIISILGAIGTAWRDAFPPMQGSTLYGIIAGLNKFTQYLVISERNVENITNTLRGLFAILDLILNLGLAPINLAFKVMIEVGRQLFEALGFVNTGILDITGNIGDMIAKFRDWYEEHSIINRAVEITASLIVGLIRGISDFIKTLYQLAPVQMTITAVTKSLDLMGQILDIYFIQGAKAVHNLIENLLKLDNITLDGILGAFKTFKEEFIDYIADFDNIPVDIMQGLVNGINRAKNSASEAMRQVGEGILNAIKDVLQIHSPSVKMTEVGAFAMEGFLNGIKSVFGTIFSIVGSFIQAFLDMFNGIALGDVFIVGSLVGIFYTMNKTLNVLKAFSTPFEKIGDVFDSLSGVLDSVSDIANAKAKQIKSEALLNIAKAIAILTGSLIALTLVDQGKLASSIVILAGLAGALLALTKISEKIGVGEGLSFGKLSVMMMSMSASILIMSFALKSLSGINSETMTTTLGLLGGILLSFLSILVIYGKFASNGASFDSISKVGSLMLKLSVSFGLIAIAVKAISLLSYDEMAKAAVFATGVTVLFAAISTISRIAGSNADKAGKLMMKMTVALGLMVGVAKLAASLSIGEISKALTFVTGIGIIFTAVIAATALAGEHADKASKMILKMSLAIGILSLAVKIIAGMSEGDIDKGIKIVGGITVMFGLLVAVSQLAGEHADKAGNMLMKMSIAIGVLAVAIRLITDLSESEIDKGIAVMTKVGLLFTAAIAVSVMAGKNADKAGDMILKMSIAIGILSLTIRLIADMSMSDINKGLKVITSITILFSAIMAMSAIAGKFSMNTKTMVFLTAYIAALSGAVYALAQLPIKNVEGVVKSLTVLMTGLSTSMLILSKVGPISPSVIVGIGVMTLAVAGIATILGIMSKMNINVSLETATSLSVLLLAMSAATGVLSVIGRTGPAAFVGIGALMTLITSIGVFVTAIGALNDKFPQLETFLNNGIPILEKIGYAIGSFVGNIIGGFTAGVLSGLPEIGKELSDFMDNLQPFIDGCAKIDPSIANSAMSIAKTILALTAADVLEGLTSWFTGGSSLSEFGKELAPFGKSLKEFSDSVEGINPESLTAAAKASEALGNMAASLPNTGGLAAVFAGENNIVDFAEQLVPFGKHLVAFSNSLEGLNPEAVKSSATAGKALSSLASSLPNSGGLAEWIAGGNDLAEFAKQLVPFGNAITAYSSSVAGITPESVTASENAIKVAKKVATFIDSLQEINTTGVTQFKKAVTEFASISISTFTSAFSGSSESVIKIGSTLVNNIVTGVNNRREALNKALKSAINGAIEALKEKEAKFQEIGESYAKKINSGLKSKDESIKSSLSSTIDVLVNSIRNKYTAFYQAGEYIAKGFGNGIKDTTWYASLKSKEMADAAAKAARKALDEHSPSRVFGKIGEFAGLGFIRELAKFIIEAERTGRDIGNASTSGLRRGIDALTAIDMPYSNFNNTVTPIMDISSLKNTLDSINNSFRLQLSADVVTHVSAIDDMITQSSQMDSILDKYTSKIDSILRSVIEEIQSEDNDKTYIIEVHVDADGREIAKVSAKYMKNEIEKIDKRDGRKGGNK